MPVGITTLGYHLGEVDIVRHNLEIAAIVTLSLIPAAIELRRSHHPAVR